MTHQEFIEILNRRGYSHKVSDGRVIVTHHGHVYLDSVTSLPEGTKFENHGSVDLDGVTSVDGTKFESHGNVYLDSVTSVDGTKFENHGYVNLRSVTSVDGTKFENHGHVDLRSVTSVDGTKFENHGRVYLRSVTGEHEYLWEIRHFKQVDGYTMLICSQKQHAGHTVYSARYFGGGDISKLKRCYIAESEGITAHGATIKEAVEDLAYKLAGSADKAKIARSVKTAGQVTLADFRALTGACRDGIRQHLSNQGIVLAEIDHMALPDALSAMAGTSYGDAFSQHLEAAQ